METMTGIVKKIRILKMSERPLVFFKLNDENCLIASRSLSFLAEVDENMRISVLGEYNSRKQFIIRKFCVLGKTKIMIDIENIQQREKVFV